MVKINPQGETVIKVKTVSQLEAFKLKFQVLNAVIAPKTHPEIVLEVK